MDFYTEAIGYITPHLCPPETQPVPTSSAQFFSVRNTSQYVQKAGCFLFVFVFFSEHVPGVGSMSKLFWACSANMLSL